MGESFLSHAPPTRSSGGQVKAPRFDDAAGLQRSGKALPHIGFGIPIAPLASGVVKFACNPLDPTAGQANQGPRQAGPLVKLDQGLGSVRCVAGDVSRTMREIKKVFDHRSIDRREGKKKK